MTEQTTQNYDEEEEWWYDPTPRPMEEQKNYDDGEAHLTALCVIPRSHICPKCGRRNFDQWRRYLGDGKVEWFLRCSKGHDSRHRVEDMSIPVPRMTNYIASDGTPSYVEPDGSSTPADFD